MNASKQNSRSLAVVVIGRNEEKQIGRCLESVFKGIQDIEGTQVLYVDSASTDTSVEKAGQFPVKIIQLQPDWFLSAAAGRYTGFYHSQSEFIFFIDGDSVLFKSWLKKGILFLKNNPDVAGVAGMVDEIMQRQDGSLQKLLRNRYNQSEKVEPVRTLGGIALYRRDILNQCGPFNPYITVDEERELALRIRKTGHQIVRIKETMAITYGPSRETVFEILRRYHSNLYTFGRTLRYCQVNGYFLQYLTERLTFITSTLAAIVFFIIVLLFSLLVGKLLVVILCLFGFVILFFILKGRRFREIGTSLLKRVVMTIRTVETYFTTKPLPMDTYPGVHFNEKHAESP